MTATVLIIINDVLLIGFGPFMGWLTVGGEMSERTTEMDGDLRSRVVSLEHQGASRDQRLTALEAWQRQSDIADARKDEQFKHMDMRFSTLDAKIDGVNGTLNRIAKLGISGIILAIVAFMMGGGFKLP